MKELTTSDRIVEEYLDNLRDALRSVNPSRAKEFVAEIKQHIADARANLVPGDEVAIRNLLERIGSPIALANELEETETPRTVGGMDRATPWLIAFGGFAFGFGWFVGLYGLWTSKTWHIWDKLLGTIIWPGGLLGTFYLFVAFAGSENCHGVSRLGQVGAALSCSSQGLLVLPRAFQFLTGFVMVAAPIFTMFRLNEVLARGYVDESNRRGTRLVESRRSARTRTSTHVVWIILALMALFFYIFVAA